jgi:redox-sensitive bicupin YhaK (pirin superfamily)
MTIETIAVRRAGDRGRTSIGWLESRHSFSFGQYYDPDQLGFRALRVINDDVVRPGQGFGAHGHRDMEILSFVVDGALEHRDSLGTGSVIRPGEVQRMTAGTGIRHSEFNHSAGEPVRFLQIWIEPATHGLAPGYQQRRFEQGVNELVLVASPDGRDASLQVHQDVLVYRALLDGGGAAAAQLADGRFGWLQVVRGSVSAVGVELGEGDGISFRGPGVVAAAAPEDGADIILFDLG